MTDPLQLIRDAGNRRGLNLIAAIPAARYALALGPKSQLREAAPEARSIIVIGNGGGDFWRALKEHTARRPGCFGRGHPAGQAQLNAILDLDKSDAQAAEPARPCHGGRGARSARAGGHKRRFNLLRLRRVPKSTRNHARPDTQQMDRANRDRRGPRSLSAFGAGLIFAHGMEMCTGDPSGFGTGASETAISRWQLAQTILCPDPLISCSSMSAGLCASFRLSPETAPASSAKPRRPGRPAEAARAGLLIRVRFLR